MSLDSLKRLIAAGSLAAPLLLATVAAGAPEAPDTTDHTMAPIDSAAVLGLALDGPAIRQNQAQIVSANASVKSAKTAYLPTLSLSANLSGGGTSEPIRVTTANVTGGGRG